MGTFAAAQGAAVQQPFGLLSDLPASMVLPSTSKVIPIMISGH
jgi:hypothetical protein